MSYGLAIDFGTTRSAGAVWSERGIEVLEFGVSRFLPSAVVVDDDGRLVAGRPAWNQAGRLPRGRVEFTPKRAVGQESVVLADRAFDPAELVAAVLGQVAAEAQRRFDGAAPWQVVLTHPAGWAQARLDILLAAAARAGLPEPALLAEPVAAALAYERESQIREGSAVAVYDLGGGTFDVAVLRRLGAGFEVAGPPGGDQDLGGELFDERLMTLVGGYAEAQDPDGWRRLRDDGRRGEWAQFRRQVQETKEILSEDERVPVHVPGTDADVSVTRAEFDALIDADVERTIALFAETVERAGVRVGDLAAIYLTGGASRIPLVERAIRERLGIDPRRWGDPKAVVVAGAAAHGAGRRSANTGDARELPEPDVPRATARVVAMDRPALASRLRADIASALKAGDADRLSAVRLILAEVQHAHSDEPGAVQAALGRHQKEILDLAVRYDGLGCDHLAEPLRRHAAVVGEYAKVAGTEGGGFAARVHEIGETPPRASRSRGRRNEPASASVPAAGGQSWFPIGDFFWLRAEDGELVLGGKVVPGATVTGGPASIVVSRDLQTFLKPVQGKVHAPVEFTWRDDDLQVKRGAGTLPAGVPPREQTFVRADAQAVWWNRSKGKALFQGRLLAYRRNVPATFGAPIRGDSGPLILTESALVFLHAKLLGGMLPRVNLPLDRITAADPDPDQPNRLVVTDEQGRQYRFLLRDDDECRAWVRCVADARQMGGSA